MSEEDAIRAIETAIKADKELRDKLEAVIARKKFDGQDVSMERSELASLNTQIGHLQDRLVEVRAAGGVISAPTPSEIDEVMRQIEKIKKLAVEEAMAEAGFDFIKTVIKNASKLNRKVKQT